MTIKTGRFVFVGTTNEDDAVPADPTGNRRWVPIPIKGRRSSPRDRNTGPDPGSVVG